MDEIDFELSGYKIISMCIHQFTPQVVGAGCTKKFYFKNYMRVTSSVNPSSYAAHLVE